MHPPAITPQATTNYLRGLKFLQGSLFPASQGMACSSVPQESKMCRADTANTQRPRMRHTFRHRSSHMRRGTMTTFFLRRIVRTPERQDH